MLLADGGNFRDFSSWWKYSTIVCTTRKPSGLRATALPEASSRWFAGVMRIIRILFNGLQSTVSAWLRSVQWRQPAVQYEDKSVLPAVISLVTSINFLRP